MNGRSIMNFGFLHTNKNHPNNKFIVIRRTPSIHTLLHALGLPRPRSFVYERFFCVCYTWCIYIILDEYTQRACACVRVHTQTKATNKMMLKNNFVEDMNKTTMETFHYSPERRLFSTRQSTQLV